MNQYGVTPWRDMPLVVKLLAGAFLLAFLPVEYLLGPAQQEFVYLHYAVIPERYGAASQLPFANAFDAFTPLVTHMFMHAGWLHLLMNTLGFLQAAPFLAQRLGPWRFLLLFFLSGIGGALTFVFINPESMRPMVGASGAICGVFGAYFLAVRPSAKAAFADPVIRNAIGMFLLINVALMSVISMLGWLPIAWEAHLGGFVVGALAWLALAPRWRGPWGADA